MLYPHINKWKAMMNGDWVHLAASLECITTNLTPCICHTFIISSIYAVDPEMPSFHPGTMPWITGIKLHQFAFILSYKIYKMQRKKPSISDWILSVNIHTDCIVKLLPSHIFIESIYRYLTLILYVLANVFTQVQTLAL